jgi:hypothetical protein
MALIPVRLDPARVSRPVERLQVTGIVQSLEGLRNLHGIDTLSFFDHLSQQENLAIPDQAVGSEVFAVFGLQVGDGRLAGLGKIRVVRSQAGPEQIGDVLPRLSDQADVRRGAIEDGSGETLLPSRLDDADQVRDGGT